MAHGDDDQDDDVASPGPRPSRADRTWVHPAEYAQAARRHVVRRRRRRLAGLAVATAAGVGLVSSLGSDPRPVPTSDNAGVVAAAETRLAAPDPVDQWAHEITARARASTVAVQSPDGTSAIANAVAIAPGGFLVTSGQALGDHTSFLVHTPSGETHTAWLIGTDAATDLAVIASDAPLPTIASAGASPQTGDRVAVVVGADRARADSVAHDTVIATSADGDSLIGMFGLTAQDDDTIGGSPVVDGQGDVVGITASTHEGTSPAGVPIAVATRIAAEIIESGTADHPWLGVSLADVGPAIVTRVSDDGPAATAGIEEGDRIRSIDGESVDDAADVLARLLALAPGHHVKIEVGRDTGTVTLWFDLGERAD